MRLSKSSQQSTESIMQGGMSSQLSTVRLPWQYDTPGASSYASQWQERLKTVTQPPTVFGLAFVENYLLGALSNGKLCAWNVQSPSQDVEYNEYCSMDPQQVSPILLQITDDTLYSIQIVNGAKNQHWVVVSGDSGVVVLDWEGDLKKIIQSRQGAPNIQKQFRPYPSASGSVEVNEFVVQHPYLYGAAGDAFGVYKWNIESGELVGTYKTKNGGYLHSLDLVPNSNLLIAGGEDGILELWDTDTDKRVDCIDLSQDLPKQERWISSCRARDKHWWSIAGGFDGGGFLATIHVPSRSVTCCLERRETLQQICYHENALISVGNESYISFWNDPLNLQNPARVRSHSKSVFAIAAIGRRVAIGGIGSVVDVFEDSAPYLLLSTGKRNDVVES